MVWGRRGPLAASPEHGRRGASASSWALRPHTGPAALPAPVLRRFSPRPDASPAPVAPHRPPEGAGV